MPRPTLTPSERKLLDRIESNFLWIYIYLLGTYCEILTNFDQAVLEKKFMKVSKIGEEDPGLRIAFMQLN